MATTNRIPFSKRLLETLSRPQDGRVYWYDDKVPGLALCVTSNDTRTFYVYRRVKDRPVRIRIGRFPDLTVEQARDQARTMMGEIVQGKDPQAAKQALRGEPTIGDLWEHWWTTHANLHKREKSREEDQRKYDCYLKPWERRALSTITREVITRWHAEIAKRKEKGTGKKDRHRGGIYAANRALSLLSGMFSKAYAIGFRGENPCRGVRRFKEESRERFIQSEEARPFLEAVHAEPPIWRDFWLVCLLCGARRGNVAAMAWVDVDLERGLWRLSAASAKGGKALVVVLPPPVVEILRHRREATNGSPWVFASDSASGHLQEVQKSWARIRRRSGIQDIRPHDLRRTLASWQALGGASIQVIGASLGHKQISTTMIYSRLTTAPVRESVNTAAQALLEAAGAKPPAELDQAHELDRAAELLQRAKADPQLAEAIRRAAAALAGNINTEGGPNG